MLRVAFRRAVPTAIAILVGLATLIDYFISMPGIDQIGAALILTGTLVAAFALVVGLANLLRVHAGRIRQRRTGWFYSLVLILGLVTTLVIGFWPGGGGPSGPATTWLFHYVYFPLNATIFSLLAFYVAGAAQRSLRMNGVEGTIMTVVAIIVLLGQVPVGRLLWDQLPDLKNWILLVLTTAGVRGMLIGVALATLTAGLRVFLFRDRPYLD